MGNERDDSRPACCFSKREELSTPSEKNGNKSPLRRISIYINHRIVPPREREDLKNVLLKKRRQQMMKKPLPRG
jgi:hypothetical protein